MLASDFPGSVGTVTELRGAASLDSVGFADIAAPEDATRWGAIALATTGDLNGDGLSEIATRSDLWTTTLLVSSPTGARVERTIVEGARCVRTSTDVDGDGFFDLTIEGQIDEAPNQLGLILGGTVLSLSPNQVLAEFRVRGFAP